ncbi:hypothetical protein [uncultured Helicobacter sp.]|uniref:hypothetical protein n=1 Tax=uncultured Helicobacter sp. TaxID=175537 RepID=UPI00374EF747
MHFFSQNDFNWNVRPSDHESKEFKQLYAESKSIIESQSLLFYFSKDNKALKDFIKTNFILENAHINRQKIDKNNFVNIYLRWQEEVKDCIDVNWENLAKQYKILDSDFYLADLLSSENKTLTQKLQVILQSTHYELLRSKNDVGLFSSTKAEFKTHLKTKHEQFWNRYERPPKEEYWDYIIERRDLLVPQNLREYQGAFFTPRIWVEKSQEYLAKTLGESYQEEYYIWDLAAGTGNLLVGLSDKYKIYASTLYKSDVDVMIQRIQRANLNLLESNVFVFDFLNDALPCVLHKEKQDLCFNCKNFDENTSKIPKSLINILQDSKKREKLIIYINPPYAEASSYKEKSKAKVANQTMVFEKYQTKVGKESLNELFAQFFIRIHEEIPSCTLAQFSTLKIVQSDKFLKFRTIFLAKFLKGFIVPSFSFDNVNGGFPIGFMVWNLDNKTKIKKVSLDVFNENQQSLGKKSFRVSNEKKTLRKWRESFYDDSIAQAIAEIIIVGPTMQSNNNTFITTQAKESYVKKGMVAKITQNNLIHFTIYFAVRHSIPATWLNDRDQFLYPNEMWEKDSEFQNDCLVFTLFHGQNRISAKEGVNHFIPFSESEVEVKEAFESHFMYKFIKGKIKIDSTTTSKAKQSKFSDADLELESKSFIPNKPLEFSTEAQAVFEAGKEIYKYYHQNFEQIPEIHSQHKEDFYKNYNANASLYDIRGYFQGFKENGQGTAKMNIKSIDSAYNALIADLRYTLDKLAKKIKPKIYEYGFLLE